MFNRHFAAQSQADVKSAVNFLLTCGETHPWGRFAFENGLKLIHFFNLMMVDWDPCEDGVVDDHYTIRSKEEVYQILEERVVNYPDEIWRVYQTPSGGIHAFLLSHKITPEEGKDIVTSMKGDLLYRECCLMKGKWAVRIGPKPNRVGDYVARYVATFGSGIPLPEHIEAIKVHDSFLPNTPPPL